MGIFLDVLLALAVVVLPLLLVWYLIGRGLADPQERPRWRPPARQSDS